MSIDADTTSLAFSIFVGKKLVQHGKITFSGTDHYYRAGDAGRKCIPFFKEFKPDAVVIEATIWKNSKKTSMQLALVQGAILSAAQISGVRRIEAISPLTWQTHIGTRLLTPIEKREFKQKNPGKSTSWYSAQHRAMRKQMTVDSVNKKYGLSLSDNDIADAIGLGWYVSENTFV